LLKAKLCLTSYTLKYSKQKLSKNTTTTSSDDRPLYIQMDAGLGGAGVEQLPSLLSAAAEAAAK
jgi:hypothetical protein